jgi:TRAP-type C4-dicarboxylate transport system permease small subunit
MRFLLALDAALARVENALLATLGLGLLAVAAAQLGFRFAGGGPVWLDPLMRSATLWLALLGALVATREGRQLRIDAVVRKLNGVWGVAAAVIVGLFTAAVCACLAYSSYTLTVMEREGGAVAFAGIPNWWAMSALPVIFTLMGLRALGQIARPSVLPEHAI